MGPLQHVDLGGGPVRGLLASRQGLGWGGWCPAEDREGAERGTQEGGWSQGPRASLGQHLSFQKRIKMNLQLLASGPTSWGITNSQSLPHHGLRQTKGPEGGPLTPRQQGTGPRAK